MTEFAADGHCADRFSPVREAFEANFNEGRELGARFTLIVDGETVVDLWGGHMDRAKSKAFTATTLTPIFSSTKAVASLMIARLVEQGRLDYGQTVASVWPEFAEGGKDAVTIEQLLSHQAGLSGFPEQMDPTLWYDPPAIAAKLAAMAPIWAPGTASGYHPTTIGYMTGEIFRGVDGRSMGTALREDIAGPLGLDIWLGLPDSEHERVADLQRPSALPKFGELNEAVKAAFLTPWATASGKSAADWRRIEIPSANMHATSEGLARLMSALAGDGELDGRTILSPRGTAAASRERIRGRDLVLPFEISWGAGFMRNAPNFFYGPTDDAFGHSGWGGSCVWADPQRGVAGAYVMNKQGADLIGDPRAVRLIEAAYAAL
ncbi:serine hydrolase [Caulobacter segnis]|uniref:serine hydrolase domain-containing protein n=1 Tax=Caulobacter segnis TaxID=88688 RepID=UPI00240F83AB|nr:serine hydrolase domain-containing protein [Caulobacter segnis]MDG2521102.1 serine hydrolase [Caulobacter segnis]